MSHKRRVALIIETSSSYGRALLEGIVAFMRTHDEWSVFLEQRDLTARPPPWLEDWDGHGIVSRATNQRLADAVVANGIPFVELTDRTADTGFHHVWSDDAKIGQLAAEHLLERGFRNFAYCGFEGEAWSKRRGIAFGAQVRESAKDYQVYASPWHGTQALSWEEEQHNLLTWIRSLPKPVGIMACNDVRGQHVLEACSRAEIAVPEEIAVVGVDDEDLFCRLCDPPLSSVKPNAEMVGYRAAETLSHLMAGQAVVDRQQLIPPLSVSTRQSTDVMAVNDPDIARVLRYIRENACRGIKIGDVLRHVPISRSSLERRMRKYLKRTPQQEIRNVQLKRARELLAETDLPMERIAMLCGFEHPEYMHVVFKRELKTTPGEFRRQVQH